MKDAIDQWDLNQLSMFLSDAETRYQERLLTEERDGRWVAELRFRSPLAGQSLPVGEGAFELPPEGVSLSARGRDLESAMRELARLVYDRDHA